MNFEFLFSYNNSNFYGPRKIFYDSFAFEHCKTEDVKFEAYIPNYIMNMYIHSTITQQFDINKIIPTDFADFLHFIKKYPTKKLTFNYITNSISKNPSLKNIHNSINNNVDSVIELSCHENIDNSIKDWLNLIVLNLEEIDNSMNDYVMVDKF